MIKTTLSRFLRCVSTSIAVFNSMVTCFRTSGPGSLRDSVFQRADGDVKTGPGMSSASDTSHLG